MRLVIAAVGRLKDGADRELWERYHSRFAPLARRLKFAPVSWHEVGESKAAAAATRMREEGEALLKLARDADLRIALHERGKMLSSAAFARLLLEARDDGQRALAFFIGGPDGLDRLVLDACEVALSLGPMTLPHALARIVLAEQLYRAATILTGHPYHRG
jgi:23S rRNA (pseudouridine1915-N3)-methyltransferase